MGLTGLGWMQPINLPVRGSRYSFAIERGIIVIFHGIAGSGGTEVFDACSARIQELEELLASRGNHSRLSREHLLPNHCLNRRRVWTPTASGPWGGTGVALRPCRGSKDTDVHLCIIVLLRKPAARLGEVFFANKVS
jgi:hypothetical protein